MEAHADRRTDEAQHPARLLVVEDDPELRSTTTYALRKRGYVVSAAADGEEAMAMLGSEEFDVLVMDIRMPRRSGIEVLETMRADGNEAEVIILTGHAETETAIKALRLRAFDFVTKPIRMSELAHVVSRAAEHRRLRRENRLLRRVVSRHEQEPLMIGQSRALDRLHQRLERAAQSSSHVLILGESGSGKELAARSIHRMSPRHDRPLLAINSAALPEQLLESELFGHEKGAFTGATERRHGLLELAHEGTLFLDEVAEMSLPMQAKLLRVLDHGEMRRVGGDRTMRVDVRVIAATNKDLAAVAASREFRHDLYYRLSVLVVEVPPLRERVEDIPILVEHFARQLAPGGQAPVVFTPEALGTLARYPWPGNVRELRNVVERLTVLATGEQITPADVSLHLSSPVSAPETETTLGSLDEIERRHILAVLRQSGGNRTQAARILGVDPKTLYNKLKSYGQSSR